MRKQFVSADTGASKQAVAFLQDRGDEVDSRKSALVRWWEQRAQRKDPQLPSSVHARKARLNIVAAPQKFYFLTCLILPLSLDLFAQELPAGTALEARLLSTTGSHVSHPGDRIEATIIAPVTIHGRIVVPQGSRLLGSVANATAIGLGLKHRTARIAYEFHTLQLPGGAAVPVNTQLIEVETAKEHVDDLGTVRGIHPIASLSSSLSFYTVPLLLLDPAIGVPVSAVKSLVAPSANPEIRFPTGTELLLRLTTPATLAVPNSADFLPAKPFSRDDLTAIDDLLKNSAQRAYMGPHPSDAINVLLIGSRSQMDRAFHASGWAQAQRKSPLSLYRMYHALTKRRGYANAPMNTLTLNGLPSSFVYQKSLDTIEKRHHVRLWHYSRRADVWLGAAAEDVGFRFVLTHWTHSTDPHIDAERAKVVNDLAFTGCISAAGLLSRNPADLRQDPNAEHPIVTDGDVAVIQFNDCIHPNVMPGVSEESASHHRAPLIRALTSFRDDLVRSNIVFTTWNTIKFISKRRAEPTTRRTLFVNGDPRALDWLTTVTPSDSIPSSAGVVVK